ncbi:unnamed protein product, partial [Onchocerca flexuosa]|uniref:Peptidase A1 domain-containing protein n=1 Tax=Onchocerca flexuosa TaxID=387005 RepID=A0A183HUA9_9BILA
MVQAMPQVHSGSMWFRQIFGVADRISYGIGDIPIDGIMGLGWPTISTFQTATTMQNILGELDEPIMTVYMTH